MIKDLTNKKFGKLTVVELSHIDDNKQAHWKCVCDCTPDKIVIKKAKYLLAGDTNSCGCLRGENLKEARKNVNHGTKKEQYSKPYYKKLKNIWRTLKNRCHNPNYKGFKNYGLKGIYVCDEWRLDFWKFYNWAIENGYQEGYSIDRLGNNYNPDNCEWVSMSTNCGTTKNGTQITIRGKTQTAAAWTKEPECEVTGATILKRYREGKQGSKLLKKRIELKNKVIEIDGYIKTFSEWSSYAGISLNAFVQRWRRGKTGKELIKPSKGKKPTGAGAIHRI